MNKKELDKAKLRQLIKKARKWTGLWANPDFQDWRNKIIEKRLEKLKNDACSEDVTTEEGQKRAIHHIIRYQELKAESEDIFKIWELVEKQAQKQLNEK
jgi:hypothetical protein